MIAPFRDVDFLAVYELMRVAAEETRTSLEVTGARNSKEVIDRVLRVMLCVFHLTDVEDEQ